MAERRPPTEPFWQFCAALNRFGVDYVIIRTRKRAARRRISPMSIC
jgi:hypothetical protein